MLKCEISKSNMPKDLTFLTRFLHYQWKENIMKRNCDLRIILNVCLGISVNVFSSAIFEVLGKQFMYFYLEGGNQLIWCEVSANIFPWFLEVLKRKKLYFRERINTFDTLTSWESLFSLDLFSLLIVNCLKYEVIL